MCSSDLILYQAVPVLDRGFVRVIDYMGDDGAVVQAARVSYGRGTRKVSEDAGLIRYLMRHRHTTPFEMCEIKFHVKLPIFVARQIMRHRQFSYQELSRRYTDDKRVPLDFWIPAEGGDTETATTGLFQLAYTLEKQIYRLLLDSNVRADIARAVLGTGLYTELWMMGDQEAWRNYFALRLDPHTQVEHREMAQVMRDLLAEHQPEFAMQSP